MFLKFYLTKRGTFHFDSEEARKECDSEISIQKLAFKFQSNRSGFNCYWEELEQFKNITFADSDNVESIRYYLLRFVCYSFDFQKYNGDLSAIKRWNIRPYARQGVWHNMTSELLYDHVESGFCYELKMKDDFMQEFGKTLFNHVAFGLIANSTNNLVIELNICKDDFFVPLSLHNDISKWNQLKIFKFLQRLENHYAPDRSCIFKEDKYCNICRNRLIAISLGNDPCNVINLTKAAYKLGYQAYDHPIRVEDIISFNCTSL